MSRVDSAIGFLAIAATVAILALVGLHENARLGRDARAWDVRKIEIGAQLFDQYCSNCHGRNAVGAVCPPLDARSGIQGGDLGPGVAWRLEELGWDRNQPYEYVYSVMSSGRTLSTRPDRYPGNRVPAAPPGPGTPTPAATSRPPMAMPAWSQEFGGPLRADQLDAIASYLVSFRDAMPTDTAAARATASANREAVGSSVGVAPAVHTAAASAAVTATVTVTATIALTPAPEAPALPGVAARGAELFQANGCVGCHSLPGVSTATVGPNLAGVFERAALRIKEPAYTGAARSAEGYLRESIRNSAAYTVPGYTAGLMPIFGPDRLTDQNIADLVAYLIQKGG